MVLLSLSFQQKIIKLIFVIAFTILLGTLVFYLLNLQFCSELACIYSCILQDDKETDIKGHNVQELIMEQEMIHYTRCSISIRSEVFYLNVQIPFSKCYYAHKIRYNVEFIITLSPRILALPCKILQFSKCSNKIMGYFSNY